jgi:hypothetical protein
MPDRDPDLGLRGGGARVADQLVACERAASLCSMVATRRPAWAKALM